MRRMVSIWLASLAIDRWTKLASSGSDDERVALIEEGPHGQLVGAVTEAARAAGARPGMRLTDARALDPGLVAVAADPAGDRELLDRLARWSSRWSPLVEVDGDDGLRLDATGVAHLFGGEAGLLRDIEARFAALGLTARVAMAGTAGAAWGLARFSAERSGDGIDAVAPLPIAALRLPAGVVRTLQRLGLKTVGALVGVPRRSLARRFREADNPLDALDRMLGRTPEPLSATPVDPPPRALLRLAEPVADPSAAAQALALLVPDLARQLEARRLGVRRLVLAGYRVDGEVQVADAACAIPTREAAHLLRLLKDKTDTLDPGFGFDAFALEASWSEPLESGQDGLVGGPPPALEVARLVDRLSVKLGADKVRRPVARASHVPERASGWRVAVEDSSSPRFRGEGDQVKLGGGVLARQQNPSVSLRLPPPREISGRMRPQRLLDRPEAIAVIYATPEGLPRRFVWRRGVHDVARAEGPERIAPEWWRERGTARLRDYYRVEDRQGRRYWIYREGLFGDGRGGDPVWYLHGLFA
ncbi:MAG: DNA polymerase Y family protein [Sphingomicrobium sp.]